MRQSSKLAQNDQKKALTLAVGQANVLFYDETEHQDKMQPYLEESRHRKLGQAFAVVFPNTTTEVAKIVAACQLHKIPIVPQGGNTGRCLGAQTDDPNAVIINLRKMNTIRTLDTSNMTITVESGCILQQLQEYVDKAGLFFPLSLGAEGSCQIGGNLATNAGGINVLRYGNTRDLTLGIEAVTPDGMILNELYGLRKNNTGYDLKNLLIGSEGTLGIITAATFRLFPPEINNEHGFIAVNSVADAVTCLQRAQARFVGKISSFELMPNIAMQFMETYSDLKCPIDKIHPWFIWYKLADANPDSPLMEENLSFLDNLMTDGLVVDATISQNENMKQIFWQIRETIVEVQKFEGEMIKFDVSVPISAVATLIEKGNKAIETICPGIRAYPFGHLGDGNLHYNLSKPIGMSDDTYLFDYKEKLYTTIHNIVNDLGGSFSAEHGVGSQKLGEMKTYKNPVALDLMQRIKDAIDPCNLMNPGKVLPPLE
ncbi:MAG: FAD-binding oxidoreductase [Ostreibacterium sp.]